MDNKKEHYCDLTIFRRFNHFTALIRLTLATSHAFVDAKKRKYDLASCHKYYGKRKVRFFRNTHNLNRFIQVVFYACNLLSFKRAKRAKYPVTAVFIFTAQKSKVLAFIAAVAIISPNIYPIRTLRSDEKCEISSCTRNTFPFREFVIHCWRYNCYTP